MRHPRQVKSAKRWAQLAMHSCMENILELLKLRSQQVHLFREILPEYQPAVRGQVRFHTSNGDPPSVISNSFRNVLI